MSTKLSMRTSVHTKYLGEPRMGAEGHDWENGRTVRVYAADYRPRMPSDGSCGCRRELEGARNVLWLCDRHAADPKIADFCLTPPTRQLGYR